MAMLGYHKKERGFNRLRPQKASHTVEHILEEFEAGKYGPPVKPEPKPTPKPKNPYEGLAPDEIEEMKRRERFKKALGGKL